MGETVSEKQGQASGKSCSRSYEQRAADLGGKPVLKLDRQPDSASAGATLEDAMEKCVSSRQKVVYENGIVAFRRRGFVYAARTGSSDPGLSDLSLSGDRKNADELADRIRAGEISDSVFRENPATNEYCIASFAYAPGREPMREYEIPEGSRWLRAGRGRIKFYGEALPKHKETSEKRRIYHAIPEGAKKVRRANSAFEWLVPAGPEKYEWKRE